MRTNLLRPDDYLKTPWKNGLGFTAQIAIHPPSADLKRGDFLWRISSARIEKDSPFSPFPNHDRVLVVLAGNGLRITHVFEEGEEPEIQDLPPLEPYEFPGDVPTSCALLNGPVTDLSVFFAKGLDARVDALTLDSDGLSLDADATVLCIYVVNGSVECDGLKAERGSCFRLTPSDAQETFELLGTGAQVLVIRLATN